MIPTYRFVDIDASYWDTAKANSNRALAIAAELGDDDLAVDALRNARQFGTESRFLENMPRMDASLRRRGDLVALNELHFDAMWAYFTAARFEECTACCDAGTALAERLGIPPVQYGTIKALALLELGRFDEASAALDTEVADDEHPFGRTFKRFGQLAWHLAAANYDAAADLAPIVIAEAEELHRVWMSAWAWSLLGLAIVQRDGVADGEAAARARVEYTGGRLAGNALLVAQLMVGKAADVVDTCERRARDLAVNGQERERWMLEEMRLRALLASGRHLEVVETSGAVVDAAVAASWSALEWRVRAHRAAAWSVLGDERAAAERVAARAVVSRLAATLTDAADRVRFLAQPDAAALPA